MQYKLKKLLCVLYFSLLLYPCHCLCRSTPGLLVYSECENKGGAFTYVWLFAHGQEKFSRKLQFTLGCLSGYQMFPTRRISELSFLNQQILTKSDKLFFFSSEFLSTHLSFLPLSPELTSLFLTTLPHMPRLYAMYGEK